MRVLITGGTGTISSGLVKESVGRGYETYAITRGTNDSRNIEGANYVHMDIWDEEQVRALLKNQNFDVVVECLAYNLEQLKISLNNFSDKCCQYVFISTAGIYNRSNTRIKENDLKNFNAWSYTREKIKCEEYLMDFSQKKGLKYTIIRPTVTYGDYRIPFPIATRNPGWTFFDRMKRGQLMLASDNVAYSIIHISDFSKMVVSLFCNDKATNEDFHISSNSNDIFWDDVIKEAGFILGIEPQIIHVSSEVIKKIWPMIYDEIAYNKNLSLILDDTKIKWATNVSAQIDLHNGINNIVNAMRTEYEADNLTLDNIWNDYCNATIYYAYTKGNLSDEDNKKVQEYIKNEGIDNLKKAYGSVIKYNLKRMGSSIKSKIFQYI